MKGKLLFPAYISDANEDLMPREYGVDATNLPTISSVGGDLPGVDSNMEADFRRGNKFRTNHFMLQRDGEILSELRIASMTITDDCGPDEEPGSTQHHTSEIDYGLSINQPIIYHASVAYTTDVAGLIDGGANGGLGNRKEMRLIAYTSPERYVNITGVGNHNIPRLRIGTFAAKVQLQDGRWVLMIFHEYGELPSGKTIHSKLQLKDNNCEVYDDPERLAGRQCLITQEGYHIPMDFKQGLAYIKMHFPTEDEVKNLPCV
eukprot:scaffold2257_cov155-Skeletonema_marinoi.AAC.1